MDALALKVEHISANPTTAVVVDCETCGTKGHLAPECNLLTESNSYQVNYAQGNPFSNTYNPGWRNHPNFSYKNNNPIQNSTPQRPPSFQAQRQIQPMQVVPQKPNLEKIMESFISSQIQQNKEFLNQDIHINELITQLGTKATPGGKFPGQPQPNPRGKANIVTLRSGNTYDKPVKTALSEPEASKKNVVSIDEVEEVERQKDHEVKDKGEDKEKVYVPPSPYKPPIPYPQRLKQAKIDNQYKKFIKVIENLHVEIPLTEAITQIPSYAKFLKDILTNKRRLDDPKLLECNSIAENKLAKKEKDPGSFSIPCILGNRVIDDAFLELGASISLMPLAVCRRLNLGELQPTKMSLQLADRSLKYPVGILEDIPVRIGQLYIPTDFVVMKRYNLLSKILMAPFIEDSCYAIDIIDECIRELDQEGPPEKMKYSSPPIREDDEFRLEPYMHDDLYGFLALTPNHMPCPKKPSVELKELPKNLRYEFLDQN
ncbi:uncharacterized protein LOC127094100 [Lathyrus oleraceus]|uniref:uncharacterized protein LOC127094100 n=1 Tax=Pisum sativum TaxID=3888 RepID=UPI0021CE86B7|nr:uncharacterized protein LOC127094100 [Pisum sativum]